MRIGLARHFLIPHQKGEVLDCEGFAKWIAWYDSAEGAGDGRRDETASTSNGAHWDVCYASDLRRAHVTAGRLHAGQVEKTALLREVPFAPVFRTRRLRVPLFVWQSLARAGWYVGHKTQPESRTQTTRRAQDFLDRICADHGQQNVLLVAHGFFMQFLARDLRRRGFSGGVPMRPRGGSIYVFDKP